jgi:hypothetical protein
MRRGRSFRLAARLATCALFSCDSGVSGSDAGLDGTTLDAPVSLDAPADVGADGEAASCIIDTNSYKQSCSVDSDCVDQVDYPYRGLFGPGPVGVKSGDYCTNADCTLICSSVQVISKDAVAQFIADLHQTALGSGALTPPSCSCPFGARVVPCCQGNRCMLCPPDGGTTLAQDAAPAGGVLCGVDSGAIDGGEAGLGQADLCEPPLACTQFNGSWRCCLVGAGGTDLCRVPDGGN